MDVLPPSTPDQSQSPPAFRRSFTVPNKATNSPKLSPSASQSIEENAETLYAHNAGKIVSFNPPTHGTRRHSSVEQGYSALQDEPVGTLPWVFATERTIAAGPLRIYRVLGSVAFLNSGTRLLKPILAKSQCWCVDGESKFVLQAGPHSYYRIELPYTTPDDLAKVAEFKRTLGKVLQYETTPCPFKRGFTIDLPEKPKTPVRKRPWKPHEPPKPILATEQLGRSSRELRPWEKPTASAGPVSATGSLVEEREENGEDYTDSAPGDSAESSESGPDSDSANDSEVTPRNPIEHHQQHFDLFQTPTRPRTLKTDRAITAPPQLSLRTKPRPTDTDEDVYPPDALEETSSLSSSVDSFHSFRSFHSPISPLPPSPTFPHRSPSPHLDNDEGIIISKTRNHKRDDSDLTVTAEPRTVWNASESAVLQGIPEPASPEQPQTPTLVSDTTSQSEEASPEAITPSSIQPRRRTRHLRQRSQSPLPSPANLYSPTSRLSGHHLTTAILQKTCSMLLGPPVSLIALMLNIASRIMNGTYNGFPFGHPDLGRQLPGSWCSSDSEQANEEEDDYGCALDKLPSSRSSSKSKEMGGSWEID
ncbi:MAG: hypothetical protein Q9219_001041 [cf. Caloplaca sp. 3 TL-2023]